MKSTLIDRDEEARITRRVIGVINRSLYVVYIRCTKPKKIQLQKLFIIHQNQFRAISGHLMSQRCNV